MSVDYPIGTRFSMDPELATEMFVRYERDVFWEEYEMAMAELDALMRQWENIQTQDQDR